MAGRFAFVFIAALGLTTVVQTQQQTPTFTTRADNVPVFVTVTDKSGRLVPDLVRGDFHVGDNGKDQTITVFDNAPQPIRLTVLVDISGSMAGNLQLVRDAARELIAQLGPGDLAKVGTFGDQINIGASFTHDLSTLLAELPATIPGNGRTPLWEAVDKAMNDFGAEAGRPVVLVLSDGKDTGPIMGHRYLTSLEISDRAERQDVMIYGVGVQSRGYQPMMPSAGANLGGMLANNLPDPQLGSVALNSGGGYFELRPRDDLSTTFAHVADELHHQYLLGFAPPSHDGKTHKLTVRVTRDDLKVRARKTYRAP